MVQSQFRAWVRLVRFLKYSADCGRDFRSAVVPQEKAEKSYRLRAEWIHRNARRLCQLMDWRLEVQGQPAAGVLYCANHISYLDIVALGAAAPMVFVSKAEVRNWPILGRLASHGGTVFLQREKRSDLVEVTRQFVEVIDQGVSVCVFLEGTSSGGETVLPFRPSLLAPAVHSNWKLVPTGLDYAISDGVVAADVAYWGDMTFAPHFYRLLGRKWVSAKVNFGTVQPTNGNRKELAQHLRREVLKLRGLNPTE